MPLSDQNASVQDALRLCASAGDEERFVGLVLTARVLPFHAQPDALLRRALDSCGFVFAERMLRTPPDSGASAHALRPLALKLLAQRARAGSLGTRRGPQLAALALDAFDAETRGGRKRGADAPREAAPDDTAAEAATDGLQLACALASDSAYASDILRVAAASPTLAALLAPPLEAERVDGACALVGALCHGLRAYEQHGAHAGARNVAHTAELADAMHSVARALTRAAGSAASARAEPCAPHGDPLCFRLVSALSQWFELPAALWACGDAPRDAPTPVAVATGLPDLPPAHWLGSLRCLLGRHLATRLPPRARAEALGLCSAALGLFGCAWVVVQPGDEPLGAPSASARAPPPAMDAGAAGARGEAEKAQMAPMAAGTLANLMVQLSAVELAMALRTGGEGDGAHARAPSTAHSTELHDDDDDDGLRQRVRAVLACATIVETCLVELHADVADGDSDGGADADASPADRPRWAHAFDDASLLAIHRAVLGVVETAAQFAEDLREQARGARERAAHPLAPVAARLLAVWLVQPSAPHSTELHARVRNVAESLVTAASGGDGGATPWAAALATSV